MDCRTNPLTLTVLQKPMYYSQYASYKICTKTLKQLIHLRIFSPSCSSQGKDAVQQTLEQIDLIKRMVDAYDDFEWTPTADGILQAHKKGKIASLIGVEGNRRRI